MLDLLLRRIAAHVSSAMLILVVSIYYVLSDHEWLNAFLPINGKPLVMFMLVSIVILYELITKGHANVTSQIGEVAKQIEINAVMGSISGLYRQYICKGEEFITDEATIMEIDSAFDNLKRLGINSYNQRKIEFLASKIRRTQ